MISTVKSRVFNDVTKAQKSELCHYLSKFAKKHSDKSLSEIVELYLEEEQYYLDIGNSRHSWIDEYLHLENFAKDVELYVTDCLKKLEIKEKQKPMLEKQKEYQRQQRKKVQLQKMEREPATKAQISYYKKLCFKHKIESIINPETASKLDMKYAIEALLDETSDKQVLMKKLQKLVKNID